MKLSLSPTPTTELSHTHTLVRHDYKRGPSYRKFNNSLLKDTKYVSHISNTIQIFSQEIVEANIDPHATWELCKIKIKGSTILHSKDKQRNQRNKQRETLAKLNDIENTIAKHKDDPALRTEMVKLKTELQLHAMATAKGAQTKSRTKFLEAGDKNTSYFLNLEKRNAANYTITALRREDVSIACSQADVLEEQVNFYSTLYKEDTGLSNAHRSCITNFLGGNCIPQQLNEANRSTCDAPITSAEISLALNKMKNGSAPGCDSLTTEFYKFFWPGIKPLLIDSYSYSLKKGHVSPTH